MNRRHLYGLTIALSVFALVLFLYKALVLGFPLTPGDVAQRWDVETRLRFVAEGGAVKASLSLPAGTPTLLMVDERFVSRGYGLSTKRVEGSRRAIWTQRKAKGEQVLYYRATLQLANSPEAGVSNKTPPIRPLTLVGSELAAAQAILEHVRGHSADNETLILQLLERLHPSSRNADAEVLLGSSPTPKKTIAAAAQVLAMADLPARTAWGLLLFQERYHVPPQPWLQVFDAGTWRTFHLATDEQGLPEDLLLVGYGEGPLVSVEGGHSAAALWSVRRNEEAALTAALERGRLLSRQFIDFSLFNLPLETQQVYRVLMLIPLGAFLLVLLRNVVGIKTFGTFMPVLIALAFRETQLLWGILLFVMLVGIGLAIRFYLEQLKLLLVPRLGALLIIVVVLMAVLSVLSHKLGLERGLSVALFPMVIITMTIERMSIVWEERGAAEALQQGLGSLLVATLGYLLMFNHWAEHLIFVFPELLLFLLAATLLLGRYSGYRLLELRRFKVLARDED